MTRTGDSYQSNRLHKFFFAALKGERAIASPNEAKLFLEAVCDREDPSRCIESLVAAAHGLEALKSSLRRDISVVFINQSATPLLRYIADDGVKQLYGGQLLRDVLLAVVDPPIFWNALEKLYVEKRLSSTGVQAFAWLLLELLTSRPALGELDVRPIAKKAVDPGGGLLESSDAEVRSLAYKIQDVLRSTNTTTRGAIKPGGRHDNDFEEFREISIFPTADELTAKERPFYLQSEAVLEMGPDTRVAAHLDNQFRLLREEMLGELRNDLQIARGKKAGKRTSYRLQQLVFHQVHCGNDSRRKSASIALRCYQGLHVPGEATKATRKKYFEENKNILKHGSFGCLLRLNEIVAFATIDRNEDFLAEDPPILLLQMLGNSAITKTLITLKTAHQREVEFVLVDTPFYAYEPILKSLQQMNAIPLSNELLGLVKSESVAKSSVCPRLVEQLGKHEGRNLRNVLRLEKDVSLDKSQTESLIAGLSQAVSLVQGPPGTGKSFIGALLAKALLENSRETILVLCYTNHALDQFLEDILNIGVVTQDMLRLGSKSTSATKHLGLHEQSGSYRRTRDSWILLNQHESKIDHLSQEIQDQATNFRHLKASAKELLEFLEFSASDAVFYHALSVPEYDEDGMVLVGRDGKAISPSYLMDRWLQCQSAGIFQETIGRAHPQIWGMDKTTRIEYFQKWIREFYLERAIMLQDSIQQYNATFEKYSTVREQKYAEIIKGKRIIGCTTTGAAKYRKELSNANPGIILVEEAGEILECHVLASLSTNTKHLVLIGDHQQLRPKVNNFALTIEKGDGFDLNKSLFERLVIGGYPHTTLAKQHRMRPEISVLVKRLMYPELQDDVKTMNRPRLRGFQSNVIFFDHSHPEVEFNNVADKRDNGSKVSHQNDFEAQIILKMVRYLAQQGYGTDQQVVLTPYLGQLRLLYKCLSKENDPVLNDLDSFDLVKAGLLSPASANVGKRSLRISTIDNYQGEESDIVIVSLTRGNTDGNIGFMAAPQRLNVLLSRARDGLIIVGNARTFTASKRGRKVWAPFIQQLGQAGQLFDGLPIQCERHPDKTALLKKTEDFELECPDGGCSEPCQIMLKCGKHTCPQRCHQLSDHSKIQCQRIIEDVCPKGHKTKWKCWQQRSPCRKCEAEAAMREAQRERDYKLDLQRQAKEKEYAAKLAEIDDEIAHERRLQKNYADDQNRDRILEQRKKDLADVREMVSRAAKNVAAETITSPVTGKMEAKSPAEAQMTSSNEPSLQDTSDPPTSEAEQEWNYQKVHEGAANEHLDALMAMIGLESVKLKFLDIKTKIDTCIRQNASLNTEHFGVALLGNPGTGKTTVARQYAKFLASVGVVPGSMIQETTGARLAADGVKACEKLIQAVLDAGGGAIFIDEAYQLVSNNNIGGTQVLDFLLAEVENLTGKIIFIIAGYRKPMEKFFAHNPGLPSRFPHELQFDDYEDEELRRIFEYQVNKRYQGRMKIEQEFSGLFCRIVARRIGYGRGNEGFGNARAVENVVAKILSRQAKRLGRERREGKKPDDFLLAREDLLGPEPSNVLTGNISWQKLKNLTGLNAVKQSIVALFDSIQFNYEREIAEQPLLQFNLNKVFLGSPGTGKTTVAKLYGQILADIGLLSNGEVVVKNPSDFVGDVLGASEKITKGILASTIGKVLVIDEAYGLHGGGGTGRGSSTDSYKAAVIDTIVAEVQSVPGDDRCVLLLGYKDQMETMFQSVNPGLSRRFPLSEAFQFEDFTDEELRVILDMKLKSQAYNATDQAKAVAMEVLKRARNKPNFGNAGEVDILLNGAKLRHQQRRSAGNVKDASTLEAVDMDPDFDRGERAATNIRMLFEGEVGREELVARLEGYQNTVANMRARSMDPREQIPFSFLFRGPPGTGKTTTARKIGKVYYDMGFLASAEVLERSVTDLVGEYVGQTGPKTKELFQKSLGKVLFIDEAYRLAEGHFAKEAMDEIVDCITKPEFAQKLVIILAGYDADINRLMSVNPGLTSRFPETIQFRAIDPPQCLDLFTKQLKKKKHLDIKVIASPSMDFKDALLHRFNILINTPNWGSARDVSLLTKAVYGKLLQTADSKSKNDILLHEIDVLHAFETMISERSGRAEVGASSHSSPHHLPLQLKDPRVSDAPPLSKSSNSACHKSEHRTELSTEVIISEAPVAVTMLDDPGNPDPGVSQEIWMQLQLDKQAAVALEQEFCELESESEQRAKEADENEKELHEHKDRHEQEIQCCRSSDEEDEAKRRFEQERLKRILENRKNLEELARLKREREKMEEERRKEQATQHKLKHMGLCVMGFRWIKQPGGYRCAGGAHFVSNVQLEL
ncbi:hypothetical protein B7463_g7259, partial [Scytalidium lignicola]